MVLTPPNPAPSLAPGPFHLPRLYTPHCAGTKAVQICEQEGEKINSAELLLLVNELLALAPECGSFAGCVAVGDPWGQSGWKGGGRQGGAAGREELVSYGASKHNGAFLQFPSRCV